MKQRSNSRHSSLITFFIMLPITAILTDVGGILGTNAWDRSQRRKATEHFEIGWHEFEERHELVINGFELGRLGLDEYLGRTVFYRSREFSKQQFQEFMFAQSKPFPEAIEVFSELAGSGKYFMATLNNESLELNLHRIEAFGLRRLFSVFFSSCFLGVKKPDDAIFHLALKLMQRRPEECLFVDDRLLNVERARQCGLQAIHCQHPTRLREQLLEPVTSDKDK
ncbi:MAG: HAD family hydrolase [Terriglobia bacterium]